MAGLTLAVSGAGPGETPARRPAAVSESPSTTARSAVAEPRAQLGAGRRSGPAPDGGRRGRPRLVAVPVLGIRAPVDPIEVEAGALTPPVRPRPDRLVVRRRPSRGRHGKAVLTGHTVHTGGGAFDDLETLAAGETVVVEATGGRVTYDVTSVRVLSPRASSARRARAIFRPAGPHRLVLITCEDWDGDGLPQQRRRRRPTPRA